MDAETLVHQLSQLGRDLQSEVLVLGGLESEAVEAEGRYRWLADEHEDSYASAFLHLEGTVEVRKNAARLEAAPARLAAQEAWLEWNRVKALLRTQQASLNALGRRIDIGRSLLSREKTLYNIAASGVDLPS